MLKFQKNQSRATWFWGLPSPWCHESVAGWDYKCIITKYYKCSRDTQPEIRLSSFLLRARKKTNLTQPWASILAELSGSKESAILRSGFLCKAFHGGTVGVVHVYTLMACQENHATTDLSREIRSDLSMPFYTQTPENKMTLSNKCMQELSWSLRCLWRLWSPRTADQCMLKIVEATPPKNMKNIAKLAKSMVQLLHSYRCYMVLPVRVYMAWVVCTWHPGRVDWSSVPWQATHPWPDSPRQMSKNVQMTRAQSMTLIIHNYSI